MGKATATAGKSNELPACEPNQASRELGSSDLGARNRTDWCVCCEPPPGRITVGTVLRQSIYSHYNRGIVLWIVTLQPLLALEGFQGLSVGQYD